MPSGDEPKRVRECRLLYLFSDAGTQTKPICLFRKGRSGARGKADIERCFIVGRGNMEVLLWPKRHAGMPLVHVTHVRPSYVAPADSNTWDRSGPLSRGE